MILSVPPVLRLYVVFPLKGYAAARAMKWYGKDKLNSAPLFNITLNGTPIASVVNVDNFSYACALPHCYHCIKLDQITLPQEGLWCWSPSGMYSLHSPRL